MTTQPQEYLRKNLRMLREDRHLTQKDVSKILNISRQGYGNYETGVREPSLETLRLLAEYYHVKYDDLITTDLGILIRENTSYTVAKSYPDNSSLCLTDEEAELIRSYRSLSDENKQNLRGFLKLTSKHE